MVVVISGELRLHHMAACWQAVVDEAGTGGGSLLAVLDEAAAGGSPLAVLEEAVAGGSPLTMECSSG